MKPVSKQRTRPFRVEVQASPILIQTPTSSGLDDIADRPGEPQVPTTMSASTLMPGEGNNSVVGQPEEIPFGPGYKIMFKKIDVFEAFLSPPKTAPSTTNQAYPREDAQSSTLMPGEGNSSVVCSCQIEELMHGPGKNSYSRINE